MGQPAVEGKHRIRIPALFLRIDLHIVRIHFDPGLPCCEPGICLFAPLHGGAGVVPALCIDGLHHLFPAVSFFQTFLIQVEGLDVFIMRDVCKLHVCHSQLLALIDIGRPLHAVEYSGQHLCRLLPVVFIIAPA